MSLLIKNIGMLFQVREKGLERPAGKDLALLPSLADSWIFCADDTITAIGTMKDLASQISELDPGEKAKVVDAKGRFVIPSWCDSHTHIVYAGPREAEFVDRIHGLTYEEIARRGGGILNSAKKMEHTAEETLVESAMHRIDEMIRFGTGAIEIKSGYGLSVDAELKMLRVIKKLKSLSPVPIKATFLGAHAIPLTYKSNRADYIKLITQQMLPAIHDEQLADYCDVFCDKGFFTVEETSEILAEGLKYGLKPKIHANELDFSGGIQTGVIYGAVSVDHLEFTGDAEIEVLKHSSTMPTLLPSTAFFLRLKYAPARKMIDAGLPVALATDYNPGSSPSGNMPFVLSLSCIHMQMSPEEVVNAATLNGAHAMELQNTHGSITAGKEASFILTVPLPSLAYLPYSFGSNLIEKVFISGKEY